MVSRGELVVMINGPLEHGASDYTHCTLVATTDDGHAVAPFEAVVAAATLTITVGHSGRLGADVR